MAFIHAPSWHTGSSEAEIRSSDHALPTLSDAPSARRFVRLNRKPRVSDASDMQTKLEERPRRLSAEDRRRSPRNPRTCEAWIRSPTSLNAEDRRAVGSVALSKHGVDFNSATPVVPGTFYQMEIRLDGQVLCREVRILHCRRDEAGGFRVGAEFH
jgi:hypothetical protein